MSEEKKMSKIKQRALYALPIIILLFLYIFFYMQIDEINIVADFWLVFCVVVVFGLSCIYYYILTVKGFLEKKKAISYFGLVAIFAFCGYLFPSIANYFGQLKLLFYPYLFLFVTVLLYTVLLK